MTVIFASAIINVFILMRLNQFCLNVYVTRTVDIIIVHSIICTSGLLQVSHNQFGYVIKLVMTLKLNVSGFIIKC